MRPPSSTTAECYTRSVQRIAVPDPRIAFEGAVELEAGPTGIVARRLDSRWRYQFPPEVEFLASSPSGVRLRFSTDADSVGIEIMATVIQIGDIAPRPSVVDLVIDAKLVASASTTAGTVVVIDPLNPANIRFEPGEPAVVQLDAACSHARIVEVWLPSSALIEVRAVHVPDGAIVEAAAPDRRVRWVHHGSSISHCMEAHGPARTWPAAAARVADVHLTNLGLAGQCHLDQFTARTIRDVRADVLSLKVGINIVNADSLRLRTFASALHGFLDTVREGHPTTPFLVVSPIVCPAAEDRPGPTPTGADGMVQAVGSEANAAAGALTLRQIRTIVADVVAVRVRAGDTNLHHLDGLALFDQSDIADLPDGLHPNGDGYERIGERFNRLAFGPGAPVALVR